MHSCALTQTDNMQRERTANSKGGPRQLAVDRAGSALKFRLTESVTSHKWCIWLLCIHLFFSPLQTRNSPPLPPPTLPTALPTEQGNVCHKRNYLSIWKNLPLKDMTKCKAKEYAPYTQCRMRFHPRNSTSKYSFDKGFKTCMVKESKE